MIPVGPRLSTMSARVLPLVSAALRAAGVDEANVGARLGMSAAEPEDSDVRISHALAFDLFDAAAEATGDDAFGLHASECLEPGMLGTVDHLLRCSRTLGDALLRARRYQRLIQDAELLLDQRGARVTQSYRLGCGFPMPRQFAECILAGAVTWTRQMTGRALDPVEVRFSHPRPRDISEHERMFGRARLRFGSEENSVAFPAFATELPLVDANERLAAVLERYARDLVSRLPRATRFTDRVRAVMADDLHRGVVRAAAVAASLRVSPRTLRRRLHDERTTARRLLDELRRELALAYLRQRVGIGEIAFALRYADVSAFSKAFKRWTGRSPGGYHRAATRDGRAGDRW
jgi:AraC-like DNA-binding protein